MAVDPGTPLRFTGHHHLDSRLVLSTLTGRPIRVSQIRPSSPTQSGLQPHEVSLLRLLESLTNGTHIEFSYTGTTLVYSPGLITGSASGYGASTSGVTTHTISSDNARGASYFLRPLLALAPFSKAPFNVLLRGPGVITAATPHGDPSVDTIRTAALPLLAHFGVIRDLELRILRRACSGTSGSTGGGGEVQLLLGHQVRLPRTLHLLSPGRVRRIRGVAYATGVAGANNARMIAAARGLLNRFCADTYVFSDVGAAPLAEDKTPQPGKKRRTGVGFGMSLVAETSGKVLYSADAAAPPEGGLPAEEVGRRCALQLLEGVAKGGCVEGLMAPTVLTLMAMGSEDVGRVRLGSEVLAGEEVVVLARDAKAFGLGVWGMRDAEDGEGVVVSVVGKGIGNAGRKIA